METRKIQFIGGATLSVSLPKSWAEAAGVRAGDRVGFEPLAGGAIKIMPLDRSGSAAPRAATFDATGWCTDRVERHVVALYLAGFDRVEVRAAPLGPELSERLVSISRRIVGLEVVERREDRVIFQDLLDTHELDARRIFERMYGICARVIREAFTCLARGEPSHVAAAGARFQDLERLAWVAAKHQNLLVEEGALAGTDLRRSDALQFATATVHVQRLGAIGKRIAADAVEFVAAPCDERIRSALTEVGSSALLLCDTAARALARSDPDSAESALASLAPLQGRLRELRSFIGARPEGATCGLCKKASPILASIQDVGEVGAGLAEIALLRTIPRAGTSLP